MTGLRKKTMITTRIKRSKLGEALFVILRKSKRAASQAKGNAVAALFLLPNPKGWQHIYYPFCNSSVGFLKKEVFMK